jgi:hypothetical protein
LSKKISAIFAFVSPIQPSGWLAGGERRGKSWILLLDGRMAG